MGENIYLFMVIALAILAVTDLVVGVSNDAVNFLNSALGSKAISFRTIMIVASIGIAFGAMSSSGMMEVARKGIFNPAEFVFAEIIVIFMAVMITDILLLDFFNTLGMPTSTTVSIVFELLGASIAIALVKIGAADTGFDALGTYINTEKATAIILGILLSVLIAFTIGAIVQFISRVLITFKFEERPRWTGSIFGGFAITAIVYFILIKGLKSAAIFDGNITDFATREPWWFLLINFFIWTIVSRLITSVFKQNIYRVIIVLGTFALAMAFAGNDLVNFIGVPIAALQSFQDWQSSGIAASEYSMDSLAAAVRTPTLLLLASGIIMILTLWFSTKALYVTETEINLAREGEGQERFQPNFLSRQIVKFSILAYDNVNKLLPLGLKRSIDDRFYKPYVFTPAGQARNKPAFDMIRASVNLMVASVLISIATSMKLPLSTTYVTFMVAMGTSLADRAWGSDSAVYRVAGVFNVIGGWFLTAIIAFTSAAIVAYLIHLGGFPATVILLVFAAVILIRNYLNHKKKAKQIKESFGLRRAESRSIQGVIVESAENISNVIGRGKKIYTQSTNGLATHNLDLLKKNKKQVNKLTTEIDGLRDHIFYFIKNLDDSSVGATNFYLDMLDSLQDIAQSLEYIAKIGHKHVNNNHKRLTYSQIRELQEIDEAMANLFYNAKLAFENQSFAEIEDVLNSRQELLQMVSDKISEQISRTRSDDSSPKNTTLYFNLLTETKDLISSTISLLEMYYKEYDDNVVPAPFDQQ